MFAVRPWRPADDKRTFSTKLSKFGWKQKCQSPAIASRREVVTRFITEMDEELGRRLETQVVACAMRGTDGQGREITMLCWREHRVCASASAALAACPAAVLRKFRVHQVRFHRLCRFLCAATFIDARTKCRWQTVARIFFVGGGGGVLAKYSWFWQMQTLTNDP